MIGMKQDSGCASNGLGRRNPQAHVRKETRASSVPFLQLDWLKNFWITTGAGEWIYRIGLEPIGDGCKTGKTCDGSS